MPPRGRRCRNRAAAQHIAAFSSLRSALSRSSAQLLLVTSIPGTNYDGADGMAAQAEILTTMEFARPFNITNLNPLQGLWPQMMPMNVYTARVQFPELLQRPRALETTSVFFVSKYAKYFYWACVPGWALGLWLLRGRPRILVLAAAVSALSFLAYATAYLHSTGNWWLPVPIYLEHALFALFWTGAIASYWGGLEALAAGARRRRRRDGPVAAASIVPAFPIAKV